ncbi:ABC transporter substrate-binding protein [Yoonia maritima]|uniref:ABC transporter substrate-binding protein n=1 Tax=Yoonia maritima TaxID=1435347 RepID=UPI000D0FD51F|nr:ABC transporter substrate-binding protein [Yoonia maritima]
MKRIILAALLSTTALHAEEFNEATLLEAARTEAPLLVIDSTGKVRAQARAFGERYGLEINGTKSKAPATIRMVVGEAQAGNVQADVITVSDTPAATAQLLEPGYAVSYVPSDMMGVIPEGSRDPLVVSNSPVVWSYNTALNDSCPVSNIWDLTDETWTGRVSMPDPLAKPAYTDWFNQMAMHHDDKIAAAYEAKFGESFEGDSATEAWVTALAANQPLLTSSDSDVAKAVGSPDATENFVGIMSTAKFRDNEEGMTLGICAGMEPMIGLLTPKFLMITADTDSPNAAKLYVHYLLTEEGWAPQALDGKMATNTSHGVPEGEPSGVMNYLDQLWVYNTDTSSDDWATRQDWQDIWSLARAGQ